MNKKKWYDYLWIFSALYLILGFIAMILFKPRSWLAFCPMGTMTQTICKIKSHKKEKKYVKEV